MWVDSHCHLNFPEFKDDMDAVVLRARESGVGVMQTICTKISEFPEVRGIAERFDNVFCSVGIHPHTAGKEQISETELFALTTHPKVIGIGETGLDYYYKHSPVEDQKRSFRTHIHVSRQTGLPLIVHTRDADEDTVEILASEMREGAFPGLIHCFSSSSELAEKSLELGFYISFSGITTFKNAEAIREVAKTTPLDRILVETDAPFLAPVPMRGKRNEPAFTIHTGRLIAEIKEISEEEMAKSSTANFFRLFSKAKMKEEAGLCA